MNNWRPIALLNVAYKVFAKALQLRLQPILVEVISNDQSAFLPMRYILDNFFLTHETIEYAKSSSQPLLFFKLDFSKVYDKVELRFLFLAMEKMGFPEEFTLMVKLLFINVEASVSINGKEQQNFPLDKV